MDVYVNIKHKTHYHNNEFNSMQLFSLPYEGSQ